MPAIPVISPQALPLTAFSEVLTGNLSRVFGGSFEYTVDNTELTTNIVTGGGTVTQGDAMAVVGTSTTTGSTSCLQSKRHARYVSGFGAVIRSTARFTAPVAGTEQFQGLADKTGSSAAFKNGLMVGWDGLTFGFHRFTNDVKVTVARGDWDDPLDGSGPSGHTLTDADLQNLGIFFIRYGYLGILGPELFFIAPDNTVHRVHLMKTAGILDKPHSYNPNYHFTMWVNNGATTSDMVLRAGSYAYFVEGKTDLIEIHQPHFSSDEQSLALAAGTERAIFTIRNKTSYASKDNYIDILLSAIGGSVEASGANNLASLRLIKDATLGGTPAWSDIHATNSVAEIDTSATTVSGGTSLGSEPLAGKNDKILDGNLTDHKMFIAPGETITVAGSSVGAATIKGSLLFKELF